MSIVNVDAASTGARDRDRSTCRLFDRLVVQHVARDHRDTGLVGAPA